MRWVLLLETWHTLDDAYRPAYERNKPRSAPYRTACGTLCGGVVFEGPDEHHPRCENCTKPS